MQNRGKRKSSKKSGKKKKKNKEQSKKKSDNKDAEQDGDGKAKIENSNGVEGTQPKKEEEREMEKEAVEDDEGSSSEDEEENLPNVGPSFVGASVLSDIYGGQRRRPSAKGRTSAGLRASEPRTVGGRRIQTPIVMPHRANSTNINKTTGDDGDTPSITARSKEED